MEPLQCFKPQTAEWTKNVPLDEVLMAAVDKALESPNGNLDLFIRFLLGISLESNQRLLLGLLTHTLSSSESTSKTVQYVKETIQQGHLSTSRSINLYLTLSEMNDKSLCREIRKFLKSEKHSERITPAQCSSLACVLLTSKEGMDEFDLKNYNTTEEGYRRLIPAIINYRKARLAGCYLTNVSCGALISALRSENCSLKELNLSNNDLRDSGEELLFSVLKLERLKLVLCNLGVDACKILGQRSSLKELDLSNNDLQDSGVKLLCSGLTSSHCKLEILRLSGCMIAGKGCSSLVTTLKSNLSKLKELDLSYNHPGESGVKLLSDLLQDPQCALEKLQWDNGGNIRMKRGLKKYPCDLTLDPNTAHTLLCLSEENRNVENVRKDQSYPDRPERFKNWEQVLSVEALIGRCYWEVEWSGRRVVISVAYRGINRKGDKESGFGQNKESWGLDCAVSHNDESNISYSVHHHNEETAVPQPHSPSHRVGVYLDCEAGILSFYSISPKEHTKTHLYTFSTVFTEPLHAGFWVDKDSSVRLCEKG